MKTIFRLATGVAMGALALQACSDSSGTGSGLLTVRLTDAPFPFSDISSVDVYIVRVDAKKTTSTDAEAEDDGNKDGWVTVATPNALVNLLDLGSGKTVNLGATTIPTGTYKSFRLVLDTDRSSITLKDGSHPSIFFPSGGQSGIKVLLDEPVQLTENGSVMTLDFDIGRSFVMRGNSAANGFNFKPVVHAVAQDITGSVSGSVHANSATGAAVPDATIEVLTAGSVVGDTDPSHVVQTTSSDASGNFRIAFLLPGTYELRATPPAASGFKPALLAGGFTVTTGSETSDQLIVVAP